MTCSDSLEEHNKKELERVSTFNGVLKGFLGIPSESID